MTFNHPTMSDFLPVAYYCLNLDGTMREKTATIFFSPVGKVTKTTTNFWDVMEYPDLVEIRFVRGVYLCPSQDIADYLDIYSSGGIYRGKYHEPNNWCFLVTKEDPNEKKKTEYIETEKVVYRTQYPRSFIDGANVKTLEQLCISSGLSLDGVGMSKASYVELLQSSGLIAD